MKLNHLSIYMMHLLSQGEWLLSKSSALHFLEISEAALRNSIKRQVKAGKLYPLLRGYYMIIPPEYAELGFVPSSLWVDDLMKKLETPYYVGLLSAASFYGASHQAPQIFQVMTPRNISPISLKQTRVIFYFNKMFNAIPTRCLKTDRGPLTTSTPEATALDLVRYIHQSGHLNHVATVLSKFGGSLNPKRLAQTASLYAMPYGQRLGALLDLLGHEQVTSFLAELVRAKKPAMAFLNPAMKICKGSENSKWRIWMNEPIEIDT